MQFRFFASSSIVFIKALDLYQSVIDFFNTLAHRIKSDASKCSILLFHTHFQNKFYLSLKEYQVLPGTNSCHRGYFSQNVTLTTMATWDTLFNVWH